MGHDGAAGATGAGFTATEAAGAMALAVEVLAGEPSAVLSVLPQPTAPDSPTNAMAAPK